MYYVYTGLLYTDPTKLEVVHVLRLVGQKCRVVEPEPATGKPGSMAILLVCVITGLRRSLTNTLFRSGGELSKSRGCGGLPNRHWYVVGSILLVTKEASYWRTYCLRFRYILRRILFPILALQHCDY